VVDEDQTEFFATEFLNTFNISGLPPHKLTLKKGQPVVLLRNVAPHLGLCNGTRLISRNFTQSCIECEIAVGENAGNIVHIPRMPLIPTDSQLPFELERIQFPIRLAFAMTINKSQGQTLDYVCLWLNEPVFVH
jgi:ATP-dependent DNA helicase PIF1